MKKIIISIFSFLLLTGSSIAQTEENKYFELGLEAQQYPTGFLFGLRSEIGLKSHNVIDIRVGYNLLDHKDFGVQESEKGGGFGFTLGYRYYFNPDNQKWFLGARSDLWFNEVDWFDNREDEMRSGMTNVVVLQPTAIVGYRFLIKEHWVITPTLAFGAEINIKTKGEEVGQGAIVLWGVNLGYQF